MSNNMITDRLHAACYIGAKVMFIPFGTQVGEQVCSRDVLPDEPVSYEEPGAWTVLGKIENCKPNNEEQSNDVKGTNDLGLPETETMKLVTKRNLQFNTYDVPPEAEQMTFGLKDPIVNGQEQVPHAGSGSMEGWLYVELSDAYRAQANVVNMVLCGKLSLQSPLDFQLASPVNAQWQFDIEGTSLSRFVFRALSPFWRMVGLARVWV